VRIFFVAGESSGDAHAAQVVQALKQSPDVNCVGIGGQKMQEAGAEIIFDAARIAVVGFVEVVKHFSDIRSAWKKAVCNLQAHKPDLLILVDYPGFNLRLARVAKKMNIKVLYYISPQIWAWHQSRVKKIKDTVDHMAVIFPFEVSFYEKAHVPVTYVGSPLAESVLPVGKETAKKMVSVLGSYPVIGLLPGSRLSEISRLMPVLVQSAVQLQAQYPKAEFLIPVASTLRVKNFEPYLKNLDNVRIVENKSHAVIEACDVVICSSGTVTLEAAILATPMVLVYKTATITYWIARIVIKIKHIGLCNILAGRTIIPELIQNQATAGNIVSHTRHFLEDVEYRQKTVHELALVRAQLGNQKTGQNVAELAFRVMKNPVVALGASGSCCWVMWVCFFVLVCLIGVILS